MPLTRICKTYALPVAANASIYSRYPASASIFADFFFASEAISKSISARQ